jgi:cation diffusion facilitator CzcD-associated flavoprotein CzcO
VNRSMTADHITADYADYDVIVVGAGLGGLYGVYRFSRHGLAVLGLEGAPDVGGVWFHNA